LLLDSKKPISPVAARRLKAVEEFSDLGAGFAIAMRDLEIRGAGNILGTQQSGHIAMVGYELYCELLEQAVRRMKQMAPKTSIDVDLDLPGESYIPRSYVSDIRQKIDLYRRLGRVASEPQLHDFRGELVDRFGNPPPLVERLLSLAGLRIAAHGWEISGIHMEKTYAVFRYRSAGQIKRLASLSGGKLRVVDGQSAYLPLSAEVTNPAQVFLEIESLLRSS
jgi:transcription-repair coupling factor (superfamily II helicase)